jgi:hypothetical protein
MNIDLETFFVFPDADGEIQETAGLEGEGPSDDEKNNS